MHQAKRPKRTGALTAIKRCEAGIHRFQANQGMHGQMGNDGRRVRRGMECEIRVRSRRGFGKQLEGDGRLGVLGVAEGGCHGEMLHRTGNHVVDDGAGVCADSLGECLAVGALERTAVGCLVHLRLAPSLTCGSPFHFCERDLVSLAIGEDRIEPTRVIPSVSVSSFFDNKVEVVDSNQTDIDRRRLIARDNTAFEKRRLGCRYRSFREAGRTGDGEERLGRFLFPEASQRNGGDSLDARASVFQGVDKGINRDSIEFREAVGEGAEGEFPNGFVLGESEERGSGLRTEQLLVGENGRDPMIGGLFSILGQSEHEAGRVLVAAC